MSHAGRWLQDRQGARPRRAADAACPRRRGGRMTACATGDARRGYGRWCQDRYSASRRSGALGGTNGRGAQSSHSLRISSRNALVVRAIPSGALAISHGGVHAPHAAQSLEAERCATARRGGDLRRGSKRHDHGRSDEHFHNMNPFVAISRSTDETGDCSACVPFHQPAWLPNDFLFGNHVTVGE